MSDTASKWVHMLAGGAIATTVILLASAIVNRSQAEPSSSKTAEVASSNSVTGQNNNNNNNSNSNKSESQSSLHVRAAAANNPAPSAAAVPLSVRNELHSRITSFFGEEHFDKIKNAYVVIVGLGGVGSHCAASLVRSGVSKVKLIDFDQVSLSSLNRHATACLDDVGTPKVTSLKNFLLRVCPWCDIIDCPEMFKGPDAERLLLAHGRPDFVLDCIDDINTKAELIEYCVTNKLNVLTSMGAGGKADPTRIRIAPLVDCANDPLATKIKWKLRKMHVSYDHVMSIFSIEKAMVDLLPLNEEQAQTPQEYGLVDNFRIRVMPVLGTSPSIFGQGMASFVLCNLAGKCYDPEGFENLSKNLKHKLKQQFRRNELNRFNTDEFVDIDDDDVEFVVQKVWKSRCAVSHKRFFGPAQLTITRWDPNEIPTPFNLVLLTTNLSQTLHDHGKSALPQDAVQQIEERLKWAKAYCEAETLFT